MKFKNIIIVTLIVCFVSVACKTEKTKEVKKENAVLAISGMTCEIGCAKTIQSKLSKKEGVLNAKVFFTDSIATIEYDANTVSKKELIAFVDGIAGGDLYKASETKCCKKDSDDKMACLKDCKMACCKQEDA